MIHENADTESILSFRILENYDTCGKLMTVYDFSFSHSVFKQGGFWHEVRMKVRDVFLLRQYLGRE